ncbi:ABC transporter substrate-binding protein [Reyranella sp.]|jgi:multiple sugar transport system substrate-binding protein|uniref:ABC transporter substrate-binding protein n=1 Tax=Reyranella sp. TaxID=1929291 RepID=UPI000BD89C0D|nr:ABC transporter substrate-binding protein [Reyranella sp.]OYY46907.1 MAG: ABC transporter substrate-binding protein [Rhodospirillales bacterium 35-66-84]OYZ96927.1 MAG: ABC transporter substrate-binding protein [Rhodospirillales bacterium 24-66-33]OZB27744.1 MAG: ABC transporter substrate-binding protein [Rhodospirillales bacterium 39-66-50]HQS13827.1 ABC transporter substrate-binding protein [Reyranella sp.]HQT10312.1 ABC transporter substrate-binding protein [Reyranella sp.]
MRRILAGAAALAIAFSAAPGLAQEKLAVWWVKGYYKAEDEALFAAIKKFEAKTGVKVDLSQYAAEDMIPKTVEAVDSGSPPDIAYSDTYDVEVAARWAFEGKLEDISDVIEPMKDRFLPGTIDTAYLYDGKASKKAFYGFVLKQQMLHVEYWKDMLATAGFKENDIPGTWKEYWSFWCDKVQPAYRKATRSRVYGIGRPMGVDSTDSFRSFMSWVDAYDVKLVDGSGKLLVDDPKVREGLIAALRDYTDVYAKGCSPPSSTGWMDGDSEAAFNDRTTILTHDYSIAAAAKWLDDANNPNRTPEERTAGRRAYDELIATAGLPRKPDGTPMVYRTIVKVGVIFRDSKNKKRAREFLRVLLEEENLRPYVEAGLGRWFPVTKAAQESPFWKADKHRRAVYDQFKTSPQPSEFAKNWKFALLDAENVWAKAMNRVVTDKVTVEKAVDELIARIKEIAR